MSSRWILAVLTVLSVSASAENNPLGMSWVETPAAKFVFFDRLEFLAPHAVQTFTNAYEWQKKRFAWEPSEPVTLLLMDSADYGNAHVTASPHNRLLFDVAPESHACETSTASERF